MQWVLCLLGLMSVYVDISGIVCVVRVVVNGVGGAAYVVSSVRYLAVGVMTAVPLF